MVHSHKYVVWCKFNWREGWKTILQRYTEVIRKYTYVCEWLAECKLMSKEWRYWKWVSIWISPDDTWYILLPRSRTSTSAGNTDKIHHICFPQVPVSTVKGQQKCINSFLPFMGEQEKVRLVVETLQVEVFAVKHWECMSSGTLDNRWHS